MRRPCRLSRRSSESNEQAAHARAGWPIARAPACAGEGALRPSAVMLVQISGVATDTIGQLARLVASTATPIQKTTPPAASQCCAARTLRRTTFRSAIGHARSDQLGGAAQFDQLNEVRRQ